jgi:hypothetical protein
MLSSNFSELNRRRIGRPSCSALPVKGPATQRWEITSRPATTPNQGPSTDPGTDDGPFLFGRPPSVEAKQREQLEERARLRAEWRGWR